VLATSTEKFLSSSTQYFLVNIKYDVVRQEVRLKNKGRKKKTKQIMIKLICERKEKNSHVACLQNLEGFPAITL
jgi:hypothetical protein